MALLHAYRVGGTPESSMPARTPRCCRVGDRRDPAVSASHQEKESHWGALKGGSFVQGCVQEQKSKGEGSRVVVRPFPCPSH